MPPKPKSQQSAKKSATPTLSSARSTSAAIKSVVAPSPPVETAPFQGYYDSLLKFATIRRILLSAGIMAIFLCVAALVIHHKSIADLRAMRAQSIGNWSSAIRNFQSAYGAEPQAPEANITLATCYVEEGKPAEALKRLDAIPVTDNVLSNAPLATLYYTARGRARIATGTTETGLADLNSALKINPDASSANAAMGRYFLDKKSPVQAAPFVEKLTQNPKYDALLKEYRTQFKQAVEEVPAAQLQDVPAKAKP
ncbi:TPA: hypothetical protein DDW35_09605 [Candidatus Sumerlaeota bacterium]|jgi:tetratricopeptide (TPR) repeat protein|nr:hypothetical protein [Candidatus Sumerlaeota bacterium]